jgi:hypothetical protein
MDQKGSTELFSVHIKAMECILFREILENVLVSI